MQILFCVSPVRSLGSKLTLLNSSIISMKIVPFHPLRLSIVHCIDTTRLRLENAYLPQLLAPHPAYSVGSVCLYHARFAWERQIAYCENDFECRTK